MEGVNLATSKHIRRMIKQTVIIIEACYFYQLQKMLPCYQCMIQAKQRQMLTGERER